MPFRNVSDLRLHDLKTLSIILQERNLTRAAELLDTTQPAISKALARLRSHFDDPLVIRNGPAMQLTPRAVDLVEPLRNLLSTSDSLGARAPPFDAGTTERTFRLVLTDVGSLVFLPSLLARVTSAGSKLAICVLPLDSKHFEARLESGEADLALGAFPSAPQTLRKQGLYATSYVGVVRKDHPNRSELSKSEKFCSSRHIIVMASNVGHAAQHAAQHAIEKEIALDRVLLRVPSFITALAVAARTDGIATVPENLANALAQTFGLAVFRVPLLLPRFEIEQYWHERSQRDPGHIWLRATCFNLFAKSSAKNGLPNN